MAKINLPQVLIISRGLIFHKNKFLFVKRHNKDSYAPNLWELPRGKLDVGETIEQNLLRECQEETGLTLTTVKSDFAVVNEKSRSGKYKGFLAITILGLLVSISSEALLSEEHSEYVWVSLTASKKLHLTPATKLLIEKLLTGSYYKDLLKSVKTLSLPSR